MNWKKYKNQLLENPDFRKEYEKLEPEYKLAKAIIDRRIERGMSQKELAEKIQTKQSSISRLENASGKPSLAFIEKIANALDSKVVIQLKEK